MSCNTPTWLAMCGYIIQPLSVLAICSNCKRRGRLETKEVTADLFGAITRIKGSWLSFGKNHGLLELTIQFGLPRLCTYHAAFDDLVL